MRGRRRQHDRAARVGGPVDQRGGSGRHGGDGRDRRRGRPPLTGDFDASQPGVYSSAYYTFEIGTIPPGAVILDATLSVSVIGGVGDPYLQHGDMLAHYFPYGGSLANVVTTIVVDPPTPVAFSPSTTAAGVKEADVRTLLRHAIQSGLTRLQVQVGFVGQFMVFDGADDFVQLSDGENAVVGPVPPTLIFRYQVP